MPQKPRSLHSPVKASSCREKTVISEETHTHFISNGLNLKKQTQLTKQLKKSAKRLMNFESKRCDSTSGKSSFSPHTQGIQGRISFGFVTQSLTALCPSPPSQEWEDGKRGNVLFAICCSGILSHRQSLQCWSTVKCLIGLSLSPWSQRQMELSLHVLAGGGEGAGKHCQPHRPLGQS